MPVPSFTADPYSGDAPLTVQFTDASDPGADVITSWEWDFGDLSSGRWNARLPCLTYVPNDISSSMLVSSGSLGATKTLSTLYGSATFLKSLRPFANVESFRPDTWGGKKVYVARLPDVIQ